MVLMRALISSISALRFPVEWNRHPFPPRIEAPSRYGALRIHEYLVRSRARGWPLTMRWFGTVIRRVGSAGAHATVHCLDELRRRKDKPVGLAEEETSACKPPRRRVLMMWQTLANVVRYNLTFLAQRVGSLSCCVALRVLPSSTKAALRHTPGPFRLFNAVSLACARSMMIASASASHCLAVGGSNKGCGGEA